MRKEIKTIASLLRIAGDDARLNLLCLLFNSKSLCVSELAKKTNMSVAIVSHHLRVMARVGMVESKRDGKRICYSLSNESIVADLKGLVCKYKK